MKMAKKMLVLAIVATGTLMGSTGTSSALADVGGHLMVENTGTVNPNVKKGTKKTSASRKRRGKSARAKNAERRRQRQLKRQRALDEFRSVAVEIIEDVIAGRTVRGGRAQRQVLLELLDEAIEMGDDDLALRIGDELELCTGPDPGPPNTDPVEIDPDSIPFGLADVNPNDLTSGDDPGTVAGWKQSGTSFFKKLPKTVFTKEWYDIMAERYSMLDWKLHNKFTSHYCPTYRDFLRHMWFLDYWKTKHSQLPD